MSNKVFGYTRKSGKDWFESDPYVDNEIEAIKDPEGGNEISLPTAIPSPFARIDLVRNAFNNIVKSPTLTSYTKDGHVITSLNDEKLVSDTLDLAELLFNSDNIQKGLKIIVWDKEAELQKLKRGSAMHRRYAETLELYLMQDKKSYNFDLLRRLYLIEYNHKIIGCTSPVTIFFPTANDLSHAQIKLTGNDVLFDDDYAPLYQRDEPFQKYLYLLFRANPLLQGEGGMPAIVEYLNKNLEILESHNPRLYNEINELNPERFHKDFAELNTGTSGDIVDVLGAPLKRRKKESLVTPISDSDFIINSSKYKDGKKPLVLQNNLNKPFKYITDQWMSTTKVPYVDESPLSKRHLPGYTIQYPYLTVSDFLEPYLIRLIYPINKDDFFDGNAIQANPEAKSFVLPLKKQFFDYFDSNDLVSSSHAKPKIEIIPGIADSVKVKLHIPIKKSNEYITFERIYKQSAENELSIPDLTKNEGTVIQQEFGITVFPFIRINSPEVAPYYRVQLVDRNSIGLFKNVSYELSFYSDNSPDAVEVKAKKARSEKKPGLADSAASQYYVLNNNFDFLEVRDVSPNGASGIIIPKWDRYNEGNERFKFAIDFGTTNTHVEYSIGNGYPRPFDITDDDVHISTLFHPKHTSEDFSGTGAIDIRELINHEFIPRNIGAQFEYKFPHRTVIAESHSLNIETETFSLADFNIPFIYEKVVERDRITSNLKWAKKEKGNDKRVRAFFEKLIMMLRNKVILNKGDLSQTQLVWFYPSSMSPGRISSLEELWAELFEEYFKSDTSPIGIPESLAPFYYFKGANRLAGGAFKPVVSIDIGGGTTDIVVFQKNKPLLLTSFKFAANSIFGDGYSEYGAAKSNGFIQKYVPYYENLLTTNKLYDLSKVLKSLLNKNKAEDINTFLFSIENNPRIKDKKMFSYNALLAKDEDLKILFLYFYSAIIYHIAMLMKHKGVALPKHIIFSGTGSKVLTIVSSGNKILSDLSKVIFEEVYGLEFDRDGISIETEKDMPKEITCKGGLMSNVEDLAIDVKDIKAVLTCLEEKGIDTLSYNELNDELMKSIAEYVQQFNEFFIKLNSKFNFTDYFNVSEESFNLFKEEITKHVRDYLEEGLTINNKLGDRASDEKEIEESFFFYPLVGAINNLSGQLSMLNTVNS